MSWAVSDRTDGAQRGHGLRVRHDCLQTAPQLGKVDEPADPYDSVIERCGLYLHIIGGVEVWSEAGAWVGWADIPGELTDLVETFELSAVTTGHMGSSGVRGSPR